MAISSSTRLKLTSTLQKKIVCPTRKDSRMSLIRERISEEKCDQRQSDNFHKCTQCVFNKSCSS